MQHLDPKSKLLFYIQSFFVTFILLTSFGGVAAAIFEHPIVLVVVLLSIIILPLVYADLAYKNWRYELTPKVMRIEKGVIWKKYISIPYGRIQNVDIYRGVLARIIGLSDIQIQTAGYSGGYGRYGVSTEGQLPALNPKVAEELRDKLVDLVQKEDAQGL